MEKRGPQPLPGSRGARGPCCPVHVHLQRADGQRRARGHGPFAWGQGEPSSGPCLRHHRTLGRAASSRAGPRRGWRWHRPGQGTRDISADGSDSETMQATPSTKGHLNATCPEMTTWQGPEARKAGTSVSAPAPPAVAKPASQALSGRADCRAAPQRPPGLGSGHGPDPCPAPPRPGRAGLISGQEGQGPADRLALSGLPVAGSARQAGRRRRLGPSTNCTVPRCWGPGLLPRGEGARRPRQPLAPAQASSFVRREGAGSCAMAGHTPVASASLPGRGRRR